MKKITAALFIICAASLSATAQKKLSSRPKFIDFTDNPALHSVPPEYANEPAFIVLQDESLEYVREGRDINGYKTVHTIWKVLDEKGIESINTIGITVDGRTRVPYIKARTILPNGKVQDVAKDMIKVTVDESGRYKIMIAPEGVEKYAEIELVLKEIIPMGVFGYRYFQFNIPVQSAKWDVSYPKGFVYEGKGYNGLPNMKDTLLGNRRHMQIAVENVPALRKEPYSFYHLHRMRAEYKLHHYDFKNDNNREEAYTWDKLGRSMFNEYYKLTEKERGAVNRYLTDLGVQAGGDEEENIKKIENGIKNDIVLYSYVQDDSSEVLDSIIAKKQATHDGYIKLFAACLTQAEVLHELGKAGDKSEHYIDKNFDNWYNLDYTLFYFPNLKKFMYPLSVNYRYPVVPDEIAGGKGVFCMIPVRGILTGGLAEVRTITPLPAKQTQNNIAAGVNFTEDMDAVVDVAYSFSGYASADMRNALMKYTKDKEKDIVKEIVTFAERRDDITKYYISNEKVESYNTNKPLVITATVNAPFLTERAGEKYVFNLGEIIGEHPSLYDKKERVMPIDIAYPESNTRTITVNIPKGYKVVNPESVKMNAEYVNRDLKTLCSFNSDYVLTQDKKNGDKLVVTVNEYYPVTHFPVADYERFKEVVNTGAEFNKASILIEKVKGSGSAKPKGKEMAKK